MSSATTRAHDRNPRLHRIGRGHLEHGKDLIHGTDTIPGINKTRSGGTSEHSLCPPDLLREKQSPVRSKQNAVTTLNLVPLTLDDKSCNVQRSSALLGKAHLHPVSRGHCKLARKTTNRYTRVLKVIPTPRSVVSSSHPMGRINRTHFTASLSPSLFTGGNQ